MYLFSDFTLVQTELIRFSQLLHLEKDREVLLQRSAALVDCIVWA